MARKPIVPGSLSIKELRDQWNALLPTAEQYGIPRLKPWIHASAPGSASYGTNRLNWLREQLALRGWQADGKQAVETPIALADRLDPALEHFTFGVEIELIMPTAMTHYSLAHMLSVNGFRAIDGRTNEPGVWEVVSDGSLGRSYRGAEVVSPILQGSDGLVLVRKILHMLYQFGCKSNRYCGFHVHIGASDRDLRFFKRLIRFYAHYEPVIDTLVSRSRRKGHQYAGSTRDLVNDPKRIVAIDAATTIKQLGIAYAGYTNQFLADGTVDPRVDNYSDTTMAGNIGRFRKCNLAALWRHKTVEFRQYQGIVNANHAEYWIRLCLRLWYAVILMDNDPPLDAPTLPNFCVVLAMPEREAIWWKNRVIDVLRERR